MNTTKFSEILKDIMKKRKWSEAGLARHIKLPERIIPILLKSDKPKQYLSIHQIKMISTSLDIPFNSLLESLEIKI